MWLLCDYGNVLSLPQPAEVVTEMARTAGRDDGTFASLYWAHRPAYDRAELSNEEYWRITLGSPVPADRLQLLVDLDTQSWMHPNMDAIRAAEGARKRGYRLAVLSNAPVALADALDDAPWLRAFDVRFFSCRLRMTKPNPDIYRRVLADLGARASEVLFFDDREDNITAARDVGMKADVFVEAAQIAALPEVEKV